MLWDDDERSRNEPMAMERFYWVEEGWLAGSSRPGGLRDLNLPQDLEELQARGIGAIVSMTETPIDQLAVEELGMRYSHIPVIDFTAPSVPQTLDALADIDEAHAEGRAVLVHCAAGQGRSATILCSWLIRQGSTADDAVAHLRMVCDRAVENDAQLASLASFARERPWVV
jgi:atypical dual specificity phosphatase